MTSSGSNFITVVQNQHEHAATLSQKVMAADGLSPDQCTAAAGVADSVLILGGPAGTGKAAAPADQCHGRLNYAKSVTPLPSLPLPFFPLSSPPFQTNNLHMRTHFLTFC